jgi:hypothetical protein
MQNSFCLSQFFQFAINRNSHHAQQFLSISILSVRKVFLLVPVSPLVPFQSPSKFYSSPSIYKRLLPSLLLESLFVIISPPCSIQLLAWWSSSPQFSSEWVINLVRKHKSGCNWTHMISIITNSQRITCINQYHRTTTFLSSVTAFNLPIVSYYNLSMETLPLSLSEFVGCVLSRSLCESNYDQNGNHTMITAAFEIDRCLYFDPVVNDNLIYTWRLTHGVIEL